MLILKRNLLSAALASALLVAASGAQAQNADASAQATDQAQNTNQTKGTDAAQATKKRGQEKATTELGAVKVTGFRASVESAIATKRDSSSIVEVVTAEDIGKLPDVSIAESLSRLPGLTAQRVDGRAQVISIRGLGPDLSTALLNGREQVTTGDNRGVEFDQYPAELLSGVVVYKTPDATLVGQGLAGTVDMRTVRPLDQNKRVLAANARYEFNGQDSLNPDVSNHGYRASATYVDQFADHTFGVTFGIAAQSTPTQEQKFNSWGYPNVGSSTGPFVIGGSKDYVSSNKLNRLGVLGTLEFKPSENFHSTLDLSYSDFDEAQHLRGIEFPLAWSSATLAPGYVV
ncbi:MAG TPA: TonB-dependent receptor plug domain-containing protein, partial [Mizugakiibacter sp.]